VSERCHAGTRGRMLRASTKKRGVCACARGR